MRHSVNLEVDRGALFREAHVVFSAVQGETPLIRPEHGDLGGVLDTRTVFRDRHVVPSRPLVIDSDAHDVPSVTEHLSSPDTFCLGQCRSPAGCGSMKSGQHGGEIGFMCRHASSDERDQIDLEGVFDSRSVWPAGRSPTADAPGAGLRIGWPVSARSAKCPSFLSWLWLWAWQSVGEEPSPALTPQVTGPHHPPQQGTAAKLGVLELPVQDIQRVDHGV